MRIHKTLANYTNEIYAANTLDAAVQTISDVAVDLGFVGAACVYSSRSRDRDNGFSIPCISLFGSQMHPACNDWPDLYNDELFKFDAVYKACLITTLPVVWSYDNRPRLVVEATRTATAGQVCAFGQMVRETGLRGGISVPIHGLGGGFGYIAFSSNENLSYLLKQHNTYADHLLGITHRFYNAMAGELESAVVHNVKLTKRELECLSLIAIGKTTDVTAEILGLSYSTVRFHLHNAERKLGTYSRMHAIAKASYSGLLGRIE